MTVFFRLLNAATSLSGSRGLPWSLGWVGSPEGLGRGSRNPLPGPLAPAERTKRKRNGGCKGGAAVLLCLASFSCGHECPCKNWSIAPLTAPCFVHWTRFGVLATGRAGPKLPFSPIFHTYRGYRYYFPLVLWEKACYTGAMDTPTGSLLWCRSEHKPTKERFFR